MKGPPLVTLDFVFISPTNHITLDDVGHWVKLIQWNQELQRLQAQAAAYQTDPMAYAKALQSALPVGDTIKFN